MSDLARWLIISGVTGLAVSAGGLLIILIRDRNRSG